MPTKSISQPATTYQYIIPLLRNATNLVVVGSIEFTSTWQWYVQSGWRHHACSVANSSKVHFAIPLSVAIIDTWLCMNMNNLACLMTIASPFNLSSAGILPRVWDILPCSVETHWNSESFFRQNIVLLHRQQLVSSLILNKNPPPC